MIVVTINARVNTWSAEISNVVSDQPCERHFTVEGIIHRGTRFTLGAELTGLMVSIRRTFQALESNLTQTLKLKPNPVFDVAPGQQRPIGAASSAEGILTVLLFPGEAVFDELVGPQRSWRSDAERSELGYPGRRRGLARWYRRLGRKSASSVARDERLLQDDHDILVAGTLIRHNDAHF